MTRWIVTTVYAVGAVGWCLIALSFLDPRLYLLTWVGLTIHIYLMLGLSPKHALWRAFWMSACGLALAFGWLPGVTSRSMDVSLLTSSLLFALFVAWGSFQVGLIAYLAATIHRHGAWRSLVYPLVWAALEFLWPQVFPWRLGQSQIYWTSLIQIAEVTGVYGVTFLMVWVCAAAAEALKALLSRSRKRNHPWKHIRWVALGGAAALLLAWGLGFWRLRYLEGELKQANQITVALVQPGETRTPYDACLEQSRRLSPEVDLIVWPESTVGSYSLDLTSFRLQEEVLKHCRSQSTVVQPYPGAGTYLLCNGTSYRSDSPPDGANYNTAFLIDEQENIRGRYHKRSLMPYGEYVPGQDWLPNARQLFALDTEYIPGTSAQPLTGPQKSKLGVLICYEDLQEENARLSVRAGANVLVNLSNAEAFGRSAAVRQHQQLAFLRAIENRRCLVRCGITGSTAVIFPTGRVASQSALYDASATVVRVPLFETRTFYTRWGNIFSLGCLTATAAMLLLRFRAWMRSPRSSRTTAQDQTSAS